MGHGSQSTTRTATSAELSPTSVYRYYDSAGVLLYVGITSRGPQRNSEHQTKKWWRFVVRQVVDHHPTRGAAELAEADLIRRFNPPFNTIHNPWAREARAAYLAYRTQPQEPSALAGLRARGSRRRYMLEPVVRRDDQLVLVSQTCDVAALERVNLASLRECVLVRGRGARVVAASFEDRRLRVWIQTVKAESLAWAHLMLRYSPTTKAATRRTAQLAGIQDPTPACVKLIELGWAA